MGEDDNQWTKIKWVMRNNVILELLEKRRKSEEKKHGHKRKGKR